MLIPGACKRLIAREIEQPRCPRIAVRGRRRERRRSASGAIAAYEPPANTVEYSRATQATRWHGLSASSAAISQTLEPQTIRFTQTDITERFGDNLSLGPDDWTETVPRNNRTKDPASANVDEIYAVASRLSALSEKFNIPDDGVYCPVCHIATVSLNRLHQPCPKCGRQYSNLVGIDGG